MAHDREDHIGLRRGHHHHHHHGSNGDLRGSGDGGPRGRRDRHRQHMGRGGHDRDHHHHHHHSEGHHGRDRRRNDHRDHRGGDSGDPGDSSAPYTYKYSTLDEVVGQVLSVAQDQNGCRFLQRKFDEGGAGAVAVVLPEVSVQESVREGGSVSATYAGI
ncbi:hypothetical protein DUNSADRAFT_15246 [Dunaliella salina]|uniref:Uncharacterized protein n=1 Tax=Dunaliella salina TaxID=3046 RepID=A0ABQ7H210_DUNSA|nr:hypothetical protein DUNSADRAFT_15246 [Dunaliella salina]|eukprot:KAF5840878.1 hypothetical protein DUNSADRAFT_15246 [Dunaliella salina]